jgi:hypothetical protein
LNWGHGEEVVIAICPIHALRSQELDDATFATATEQLGAEV